MIYLLIAVIVSAIAFNIYERSRGLISDYCLYDLVKLREFDDIRDFYEIRNHQIYISRTWIEVKKNHKKIFHAIDSIAWSKEWSPTSEEHERLIVSEILKDLVKQRGNKQYEKVLEAEKEEAFKMRREMMEIRTEMCNLIANDKGIQ